MIDSLPVALIQMDSCLGNPAGSLAKALDLATRAAQKGTRLLVLPELFTTGYNLSLIGQDMTKLAEDTNGPTVQAFKKLCREQGVYAIVPLAFWPSTLAESCGTDLNAAAPLNAALLMDDTGNLTGVYAKCHLYDREREFFTAGETLPVFETPLGRIGLMICYDAGFPEVSRILRAKGAEIIVCPSAWNANDLYVWDLNMPGRALENVCYLLAVNRVGQEGDLTLGGQSLAVGPDGKVLGRLGNEEGILFITLDGHRMREADRTGGPYLHWTKPELYEREYRPLRL